MKNTIILILFFTIASCTNEHKVTESNQVGFVSRIHRSDYDIDWYKFLGPSNLAKHLSDLNEINWEKEYWEQRKLSQFNMPCLEVIDTVNSTYLTISVCPKTESSFQFEIGYGEHLQVSKTEIKRYIKVYGTESDKLNKVKKILFTYFNREEKIVQDLLNDMFYLFEVEDVYLNIKENKDK